MQLFSLFLRWHRQSPNKLKILSLLSVPLYLVFFILAHPLIGDAAEDLSIFPAVMISWLYGAWGGVLCSVLLTAEILLVHRGTGTSLFARDSLETWVTGFLALLGISLATAAMRRFHRHAAKEIAERKKIEENLRVSEQKYRLLFENMTEGIAIHQLVYNDRGRLAGWVVQDVNPAYEKITGIPRSAAIGQNGSWLVGDPGNTRLLLENYERAAKEGVPVQFETFLSRLRFMARVTATPMMQNRLAVIINDITEQHRSMYAECEQRRQAEALRDIAAALTGTLDLEVVLNRILQNIHRIASYDAVNVMLIHQNRVSVVRHQGYIERGLETYISEFNQPYNEISGLRWIAEHRTPLVVGDTQADPQWVVFPPTAWVRSYAGLPIQVRGELIGFLNLNSAMPGFFDETYIDRLRPFADQAALAIANARAYEDTERKARRLALVNRIAITLNQPLELKTVLQLTVDCLVEALNLEQTDLALFNQARDQLTVVADHPAPGSPTTVGVDIAIEGNRSMEIILRDKTSLLIEDARLDHHLDAVREIMVQRGVVSMLLTPLLVRNEVIGTIGCSMTEPNRQFSAEEIELAETITNLAAVRIEQARLYAEERKRASELALLHVTSLAITSQNNLPTLLQTIIERAAWLVGAPGGTLYLADPQKQELECRVCYNFPEEQLGTVLRYGEGAAGTVAETQQPLVIADYQAWPLRVMTAKQIGDFLAVASIPISHEETVTGVIQLGRIDPQQPFTPEEIDLLTKFSSQVAISLENARCLTQARQDAVHDLLTGLYNRRGLFEVGQREIERSQRLDLPLSVLMLDIDHFKLINDTHGHQAGDQVLAGLAEILRKKVRGMDIISRYGGEEFILMLTESGLRAAKLAAERICKIIAQTPIQTEFGDMQVTVSIGAAELNSSMEGLQGLIRTADEALYHAKRNGRNRVEIAG